MLMIIDIVVSQDRGKFPSGEKILQPMYMIKENKIYYMMSINLTVSAPPRLTHNL